VKIIIIFNVLTNTNEVRSGDVNPVLKLLKKLKIKQNFNRKLRSDLALNVVKIKIKFRSNVLNAIISSIKYVTENLM
jgi:hypothetical protein